MGGMVAGLSRPAAAEFSFFLAIPAMFAACGYSAAEVGPATPSPTGARGAAARHRHARLVPRRLGGDRRLHGLHPPAQLHPVRDLPHRAGGRGVAADAVTGQMRSPAVRRRWHRADLPIGGWTGQPVRAYSLSAGRHRLTGGDRPHGAAHPASPVRPADGGGRVRLAGAQPRLTMCDRAGGGRPVRLSSTSSRPARSSALFSGTFFGLVVGIAIAYALSFVVELLVDQMPSSRPRRRRPTRRDDRRVHQPRCSASSAATSRSASSCRPRTTSASSSPTSSSASRPRAPARSCSTPAS